MENLASPFDTLLLIGLALWAIVLFGGFIFGAYNETGSHRIPRRNRMTASLIIVIIAWMLIFTPNQAQHQTYLILIALGMTFGFIGDLLLADLIPIKEATIAGMLSFGIGHVAYIIGILTIRDALNLNDATAINNALGLWLVFGAVGWFICVYINNERELLHYLALPYSLLLSSTAGFFMGLALQDGIFWLPTIGAILFLFSDLVLSLELFRDFKPKSIGDVVWLTYSPGQMSIVCGLWLALYLG